jgi:RHS repeat-associated protein
VSYAYDNAGRRQSMTVIGQTEVSYTFDNANRLTGITQGSSSVAFAYDGANRRTSLTLPNGIVVAYSYDSDSRVSGLTWTQSGGTEIGDLEYTYDADGRVTKKTGTMAATNLPNPVTGNSFNVDNEMTAFGGQAMTYDANGNLTNDGTNSYSWDARNHLTGISGGSSATFAYDPFGRRASKTINSTNTQFLYDDQNPVQELQGGSPSANLLTGLGIDEYFNRTDSLGSMSFLSDDLGTTLALTDAGGNLSTSYTYDPFGNASASGAASTNSYQFTGRENDGVALDYFRARYYSPNQQRFTSQDPIGFEGGDINLYGYVLNSPQNGVDPSGKGLLDCAKAAAQWSEFNKAEQECSQEWDRCNARDDFNNPLEVADEQSCKQDFCTKYGTSGADALAAIRECACRKIGRGICLDLFGIGKGGTGGTSQKCGLTGIP